MILCSQSAKGADRCMSAEALPTGGTPVPQDGLFSLPDNIAALRQAAMSGRTEARFLAQLRELDREETKDGKPFCKVTFADGGGDFTLRVWQDSAPYLQCGALQKGDCVEVHGWFSVHPKYGLESKDWKCRPLSDDERNTLFSGPADLRAKQEADWGAIVELVGSMPEGDLRTLCHVLLTEFEEKYRRAAAARGNHHARRGGLVEHVAQMMRCASALCTVYPMRRDLLLAGVLFHDAGKMWENQYEETGFEMPFSEFAEELGHIAIGFQLLNELWKKAGLQKRSDRDLLAHLVLSHHGELQWGSPVQPKCIEAQVLHYVDQIDAKVEMMKAAYLEQKEVGPGVVERTWPLGVNLIKPRDEV